MLAPSREVNGMNHYMFSEKISVKTSGVLTCAISHEELLKEVFAIVECLIAKVRIGKANPFFYGLYLITLPHV